MTRRRMAVKRRSDLRFWLWDLVFVAVGWGMLLGFLVSQC